MSKPSEITSISLTAAETRVFLFKVDSYSWARRVTHRGQCFESDTFTVGGCEWAVRYYPNGKTNSNATPWMGLVLRSVLVVDYVRVRFGCVQADDEEHYTGKPYADKSFNMCKPESFSDYKEESSSSLAPCLDLERLDAVGKEKDCFEVLCKISVLRAPFDPADPFC